MKSLKIIYYIFVGFIAFIALLLIVSVFPIPGNYKVLTVLSGSMEPKIKTGSVVVVKPAKDYGVGDIITFGKISKTETPITHRIKEVKLSEGNTVYVTKGDANESADPKEISKNEVIGKTLFSVPFLGYAIAFAKKPVGFMILIIIPAIVIIYDELKKIWQEILKMKKKKEKKE